MTFSPFTLPTLTSGILLVFVVFSLVLFSVDFFNVLKKIYDDFIGSNIDASVWSTGFVDFYSSDNPIFGDYCIRWSDADQYNHIRFDFIPDINLELLEQKGYLVSFWVKGSKKISSFDIRFLNDQDTQLPWRMRSTIDSTKVVLNNVWQ